MNFFTFCATHNVTKRERVALAMHLATMRSIRTFQMLAGVRLR